MRCLGSEEHLYTLKPTLGAQTVAKYKAYEEEQRKKTLLPEAMAPMVQLSMAPTDDAAGGERRKRMAEQEDVSIEKQV